MGDNPAAFRSTDSSEQLQVKNDANKIEANKLPVDVFHEAIDQAFGAKDNVNKLVRAGDKAPNAVLGNLSISAIDVGANNAGAGLKQESFKSLLPPSAILAALAGTATAGSLIEMQALKSAKELAFNHKAGLQINTLDGIWHGEMSRDFLDAKQKLGEMGRQMQSASLDKGAATIGLGVSNAELKVVAEQYKTPFAEIPGVDARLARERHLFFNSGKIARVGYLGQSAADYIGSADEIANGQKLFQMGSREANMLTGLENSRKLDLSSTVSLGETEAAFRSNLKRFSTSESRIANASYLESGMKGAGLGLLASAASIGAAYAADSVLGNDSALNSTPRMLLDGVAVPAVILSEIPTRYKVGLAGTAFVASRVMGYMDSNNVTLGRTNAEPINLIQNRAFSSALAKPGLQNLWSVPRN